jgi:hypothetical protein
MPTVPKAEDRKLTFRRRVRLDKQEEKALARFLVLLEEQAKAGAAPDTLKGTFKLAETGVRYLGGGCYKVAFALPGDRYVIKVPRGRNFATDLKNAGIEAEMYDRASVELRPHLATTRKSPKPYATLQEMAAATVGKILDDRTHPAHGTIRKQWQEFVDKMVKEFKLAGRDLHQENIAVRSDGSLCVIDFALEKI